uniref:Putative secreted peptide n=1 Tax=Anopheles braziliensis TaxID=58242 RepID=A0A2M3ZU54_9DIPT
MLAKHRLCCGTLASTLRSLLPKILATVPWLANRHRRHCGPLGQTRAALPLGHCHCFRSVHAVYHSQKGPLLCCPLQTADPGCPRHSHRTRSAWSQRC